VKTGNDIHGNWLKEFVFHLVEQNLLCGFTEMTFVQLLYRFSLLNSPLCEIVGHEYKADSHSESLTIFRGTAFPSKTKTGFMRNASNRKHLRKVPIKCAFFTITPSSSRIALTKLVSQIEASMARVFPSNESS
jgi:hypothetical protein